MALVWDFYRTIGAVDGLGGNVHYFDTIAQSIFVNNGMSTDITEVVEGQWETATYEDTLSITTDYDKLTLDHPSNGVLYFAAGDGNDLYFLRYVYSMDISDLVEAGDISSQIDNQIIQMSANIKNISDDVFVGDATLFNPGAKLTLLFQLGDSDPYAMGVLFLDEINYDSLTSTVPISSRNSIGYLLSQTFDTNTAFVGLAHVIAADILDLAGIESYSIQTSVGNKSFSFDPNDTLLDGLKEMFEYYVGWKMVELPDGTIVIGYDAYIKTFVETTYYTFNSGKEVFKWKTSKNADAAYTHVYVKGDDGISPVFLEVNNWSHWNLGAHKTKHINAPEGMDAAELLAYATQCALDLQYVGISEAFISPLRPQLLVGDVAEIYTDDDPTAVSLGLITEVKHSFGEQGFLTEFAVDSGGVTVAGEGEAVDSRARSLTGYNRKQRIIDLVEVAINKGINKLKYVNKAGTAITANVATLANNGVPEGGTTNQILKKSSNNDYDTEWTNSSAGTGDVVGPVSAVDSNFAMFDTATGKLLKDSSKTVGDFAFYKKGNSTFTDNDMSQTFNDADCTADSLVIIVITSVTPPQGVWSVESASGSFTITSSVAESADIAFDYYIQRVAS